MKASNADIYEYQFNALFQKVKTLIGGSTIRTYKSEEEEAIDKEVDDYIGNSSLLFDVSGKDFRWFKAADSEYRYWVEVYILKIIENIMTKIGICFEEKYHSGHKEQHSIICNLNGRQVEAYFLYDIEYEEANCTDYDKIASVLKAESQEVEAIEIFIFRDCINHLSLAGLVNGNMEMNENGFVSVYPLKTFFDAAFGEGEYSEFFSYANAFQEKCNTIISYKTVIAPTKKTIEAFKANKIKTLMHMDYKRIAQKGQSGELTDEEFEKVKNSYLTQKMYFAMLSSNDFADSFISAEWSYDVYSNAMGELELTGIIAGYLKSIEQLLFTIARFHRDQGIEIKTRYDGYQPYTSDNEINIDSTLGSLNSFVTSKDAKLAITAKIRGCIHKAISLWTQYQRNGYFHKDNLYASDNKIGEVRELTIYLYFLILGGLRFSVEEKTELGVYEHDEEDTRKEYNEEAVYQSFEEWMNNTISFDLPERIPGLWILITNDENIWTVHTYLMTYFYIDEFESSDFDFSPNKIAESHTKDVTEFSWVSNDKEYINAHNNLIHLFDRYSNAYPENMDRIGAIVLGIDKYTQLIHYREQ